MTSEVIKVAIWENQTKKAEVWFNIEITRSYKEGDEWQESTKFGRDDLPIVAKAADMAYAWITPGFCRRIRPPAVFSSCLAADAIAPAEGQLGGLSSSVMDEAANEGAHV